MDWYHIQMSEVKQNSPKVRKVVVEADHAGQRIDNFLLGLLKGVPKSYVYRVLRRGEVRLNKGRVAASQRLQEGDVIRVPPVRVAEREIPPEPGTRVLERLEQAILYEDKRLLVLNKPSGIAVHGGSGVQYGVIEALRALRPEERQLELVHRLDRDTSGCLLIAKRRSVLRILHELLRGDGVEKRYLALVAGRWEQDRETVKAPLRKNTLRSGERVVRVDREGKPATTRFRVLERFADATLLEAQLLTGRTHQIRVHLAHLGTPVLGDEKYGDADANRRFRELGLRRLFLHAESLAIHWPEAGEGVQRFEAPLEPELQQLLERLPG
jgi:23S rRNA pseudouridine955/2504/2580 synthase